MRTLYWLAVLPVVLAPLPGQAQSLQAQSLQALKSAHIDLPTGNMTFPPGPGVEAITNNCLICHSAGMVLTQPALPKSAWDTEVHKMINVYKAPVAAEDVAAIVGYLAATKGVEGAR
ncbi:MAG TPA: cytochrome c [Rhodopila sp.]|uniref:cytochrome c n=1 Tax=Rhodopila sp. TaxID=2480087 RepID=UPI002C32F706|nr:cytochrome c [Rhodopila sp.]HVY13599.1 cytochrome c [Rhodopila sp.]